MDPDAALDEARELLEAVRVGDDFSLQAALNLADVFEAIDTWMTSGGYTPTAWRTGPTRRDHV